MNTKSRLGIGDRLEKIFPDCVIEGSIFNGAQTLSFIVNEGGSIIVPIDIKEKLYRAFFSEYGEDILIEGITLEFTNRNWFERPDEWDPTTYLGYDPWPTEKEMNYKKNRKPFNLLIITVNHGWK